MIKYFDDYEVMPVKLKPCPFCGAEMMIECKYVPANEPGDYDGTLYFYHHATVNDKVPCQLYRMEQNDGKCLYGDEDIAGLLEMVEEK